MSCAIKGTAENFVAGGKIICISCGLYSGQVALNDGESNGSLTNSEGHVTKHKNSHL